MEEDKPFLEKSGNGDCDSQRPSRCSGTNRCRITYVLAGLNVLLLSLSIVLGVALLQTTKNQSFTQSDRKDEIAEPYSPANAIIEYEYRTIVGNDSRYTGYPGPVWEETWHSLMAGTLIKLSKEELELQGSESIPLKDGGYAGAIGVGHNLHCIKKIKQYLYRDYFYPELEDDSPEMLKHLEHADHCLDWIRQGVMCYVDTSMYTMWWENPINPTHKLPGPQKCVNWDKLHGWMKDRSTSKSMLVRQ